eukprot:363947-Chlamydomonas_euryale.AAC.2
MPAYAPPGRCSVVAVTAEGQREEAVAAEKRPWRQRGRAEAVAAEKRLWRQRRGRGGRGAEKRLWRQRRGCGGKRAEKRLWWQKGGEEAVDPASNTPGESFLINTLQHCRTWLLAQHCPTWLLAQHCHTWLLAHAAILKLRTLVRLPADHGLQVVCVGVLRPTGWQP